MGFLINQLINLWKSQIKYRYLLIIWLIANKYDKISLLKYYFV